MLVRGVTLLEILVVLVVAGVLAALALPAYRQHLVRVNRSEATVGLHEIASAQERFYLRHGRYAADPVAPPPQGLGLAHLPSRRYAFSIAMADDGQTFIASATPTAHGGQLSDSSCGVFSLDQRGRRAVSGSRDATSCWR